MNISAFAYGVDVPMSTAIYQALIYVAGPLAPYLYGAMFIGLTFVMYYVSTHVIPTVFKFIKKWWNKFKSRKDNANLVHN